jgi:hypothetical protein
VLLRRWVVERSFSWLSKYRRVAGRDHETNPCVSEAIIKVCFAYLVLRQLAKGPLPKHGVQFSLLPLRAYYSAIAELKQLRTGNTKRVILLQLAGSFGRGEV